MKMMEETAQGMFASTIVYEVPPYQRSYVWEKADQWQPLWNDLTIRAKSVANGGEPTHFMGAVVLLRPKADQRAGGTRIVVDGQQRLVTVQILCLAVEKALRARGLAEAADRIATMIPRGTREQDWKIAPSLGDKAAFRKAMAAGNEGHEGLVRAKRYFREECDGWLESVTALAEERGNALSRVLCQGLTFGVIVLEDEETQYAVFETLNARGTELTQSDLAKNHIVEIWRRRTRGWPSEAELQSVWPFEGLEYKGKTDRGRRALPKSDEMLRHWLCARMAMEVRQGEICKTLKIVLREQFDDDVVAMGKVLNRVAERWARWTAQDTWEAPSGSPAERIRAAETWAWGPVLMALDERGGAGARDAGAEGAGGIHCAAKAGRARHARSEHAGSEHRPGTREKRGQGGRNGAPGDTVGAGRGQPPMGEQRGGRTRHGGEGNLLQRRSAVGPRRTGSNGGAPETRPRRQGRRHERKRGAHLPAERRPPLGQCG